MIILEGGKFVVESIFLPQRSTCLRKAKETEHFFPKNSSKISYYVVTILKKIAKKRSSFKRQMPCDNVVENEVTLSLKTDFNCSILSETDRN